MFSFLFRFWPLLRVTLLSFKEYVTCIFHDILPTKNLSQKPPVFAQCLGGWCQPMVERDLSAAVFFDDLGIRKNNKTSTQLRGGYVRVYLW